MCKRAKTKTKTKTKTKPATRRKTIPRTFENERARPATKTTSTGQQDRSQRLVGGLEAVDCVGFSGLKPIAILTEKIRRNEGRSIFLARQKAEGGEGRGDDGKKGLRREEKQRKEQVVQKKG